MTGRIPCTALILTRDSAAGIRACLDALAEFDEVIVQDGHSTDGTREIASTYANVRLLDQHKAFLDESGRITDFAAMRNDALRAAKHDWIFQMDSDEQMGEGLVEEIASIVGRNKPAVYDVFRRFVIGGEPVIFCAGYPALQIRLFHRLCTDGYIKPIHERLRLKEGVLRKRLTHELLVPLPPARDLQSKYDRYLMMEVRHQGEMSWDRWFRWILYRNLRSAIGLTAKVLWLRVLPQRGKRMPLSHEFAYVRHQLRIILHTLPLRFRS